MKISRRWRVAAFLAFIIVVSACGGADSTPASSAAPPATSTPTTLPPATTPPPATTSAPATPTTSAPAPTTQAPTTAAPVPATTVVPVTEPPTGAQLAFGAALTKSAGVASARMEGVFEISGIEGGPPGVDSVAMSFSAAFDLESASSSFVIDLTDFADAIPADELPPGLGGLFGEIEVRQIGDTSYIKLAFLGELLGTQTDWISFPVDEEATAEGLSPIPAINPAEILGMLRSVGATVTEVGTESIRGVEAIHYAVTFSLEDLLAQVDPDQFAQLGALGPVPFDEFPFGELPVDIWISEDGLVHRVELVLDLSDTVGVPGEGFGMLVMRFDMFDHGLPLDIQPLPADDVTDASEMFGPLEI